MGLFSNTYYHLWKQGLGRTQKLLLNDAGRTPMPLFDDSLYVSRPPGFVGSSSEVIHQFEELRFREGLAEN